MKPLAFSILFALLLLGVSKEATGLSITQTAVWALKKGAKLLLSLSSDSTVTAEDPPADDEVPSASAEAPEAPPAPYPIQSSPGWPPSPGFREPSASSFLFEAGLGTSAGSGRYPTCWKKALMELERSCKQLDAPLTQRFALELTRCHLKDLGRTLPKLCDRNKSPRDGGEQADDGLLPCLWELDELSVIVYTEFFSYCSSICFLVQTEIAQAQTEAVITALTRRTVEAVEVLHHSHKLQMDMLEKTQRAAVAQEQLGQQILSVSGRFRDEFFLIGKELEGLGRVQSETLDQQRHLHALLEQSNEDMKQHAKQMQAEFVREASRLTRVGEAIDSVIDGLSTAWRLLVAAIVGATLLARVCALVLVACPPSSQTRQFATQVALILVMLSALWSIRGLWLKMLMQAAWTVFFRVSVLLAVVVAAPQVISLTAAHLLLDRTAAQSGRRDDDAPASGSGESDGLVGPDELGRLSRKELQRRAKNHGLAANGKTVDIIRALSAVTVGGD